jgi:hypothetical protein
MTKYFTLKDFDKMSNKCNITPVITTINQKKYFDIFPRPSCTLSMTHPSWMIDFFLPKYIYSCIIYNKNRLYILNNIHIIFDDIYIFVFEKA